VCHGSVTESIVRCLNAQQKSADGIVSASAEKAGTVLRKESKGKGK
jgi:hypothetical protein